MLQKLFDVLAQVSYTKINLFPRSTEMQGLLANEARVAGPLYERVISPGLPR